MFSEAKAVGKNNSKRKGASVRDVSVTILTSGCHFEGKLHCKGTSRVGGKIKGTLVSEGLLIVEEEAVIEADMHVDEIVVLGRASGKLKANKRIELHAGSIFKGEIISPALVVREGAKFDGKATMVGIGETEEEVAVQLPAPNNEPELAPDEKSAGSLPDVAIMDGAS